MSKESRIHYIYGLVDPLSNKIRYIGKTINIKKRLSSHLEKSSLQKHTHKNSWIKSLLKKELDYIRGWYFCFSNVKVKLPEYSEFPRKKNLVSIQAVCIKTKKVIKFRTKTDAKEKGFYLKGIDDCLKGLRKQSQGYMWYYG